MYTDDTICIYTGSKCSLGSWDGASMYRSSHWGNIVWAVDLVVISVYYQLSGKIVLTRLFCTESWNIEYLSIYWQIN